MLILTRRPDASPQSVIMLTTRTGQVIEVTLLEVEGQQIRLGITAPRSVIVLRAELADQIPQSVK